MKVASSACVKSRRVRSFHVSLKVIIDRKDNAIYARHVHKTDHRLGPVAAPPQRPIEQTNWTQLGKLMGWERYHTTPAVEAMNDL